MSDSAPGSDPFKGEAGLGLHQVENQTDIRVALQLCLLLICQLAFLILHGKFVHPLPIGLIEVQA
jgi:hypothetical protein